MANKYQSTKSGRQIDRAVEITEKIPSQIEVILNEIKILQENQIDKDLIPQKLSDLINDITDQTYNSSSEKPQSGKAVAEAIANLLGTAPENLDTLEELAKALNEDENFAAKVIAELTNKADKVDGKGLSTNDFTDALKNKLNNIDDKATSSPKVITVDFEQNSEEWESWNDKTFFNQYSNGLYYITGGYVQEEVGGGYYESVILLCTNYDDGGPIIDRLLITDNGDMYSNFEYWWEDEDNNVWQKISVSQTDLDKKVDKVDGKGLSTNDFTTALKNKLDGIEPNATALPKVINIYCENQLDERISKWNNKSLFNEYTDDGLYYFSFKYNNYGDINDESTWWSEVSDDALLLVNTCEDGGPQVYQTLITNGNIYTNFFIDGNENVPPNWELMTVSQTDLDKAIGDVETSLENIIQKYGLGGDGV